MPFSMSNNSKHIINNLQELAKKPKYEYEWYNKIFESMQNVDGGVLKEVVDFFLGLELENLQELKDSCNDLQEIQNRKPRDLRYSNFGTGYIEEEGNKNGASFLLKKDIKEILSKKIIPIVEKQENIKRIFAICDELEKMAGKSEEEVYKYLNGEVFICCNRDVFTTDDMQLIEKESYKILFRYGNQSVIEFLHQAVVANLALDDDRFRKLIKSFVKDQAPNNSISIIDGSSTSCCCSLAFLTF